MPSEVSANRTLRLGKDERYLLRTLTTQVVTECLTRLKALHDADYEFKPQTYPVRDINAHGTFGTVGWSSMKDGPRSYKSAIGPSSIYRRAIDLSDIDSFQKLLTVVRSEPLLETWMTPSNSDDEQRRENYRTQEVANLPLSIVDRHIHTAGWEFDPETFQQLFEEMETWWLYDVLPVELWIPILGIDFACDLEPLDGNTRVERLSEGQQLARWPGQRLDGQEGYVAMATHAVVVSGWTAPNQKAFHWWTPLDPPETIPAAEHFLEALAVVTPNPSGYVQAIAKPIGWSPGYVAGLPVMLTGALVSDRKSSRLKPAGEPSVRLDTEEIESLRRTYRALPKHKEVALAATRLLSADRRGTEADRIVDLCVGLESLLSDSQGETTYKIALRSLGMLAHLGIEDPSKFFAPMKTVYAHRSSVVHGRGGTRTATVSLDGETFRTELLAQLILRLVLKARVENPELTPSEIDQRIIGKSLDRYSRMRQDAPNPTTIQEGCMLGD